MTIWTPSNSGSSVAADFAVTRSMGYSFEATNPVIGYPITKAKFQLFAGAAPNTYDIYCKIYSSAGVLKETSTTTIDATTVVETPGIFEWSFAGTYTVAVDDYIAIVPGDGTNVRMDMLNTSSDAYLGCRQDIGTATNHFSPSRYPTNVEITYGTPPPSSGGTRLPPPPLIARF